MWFCCPMFFNTMLFLNYFLKNKNQWSHICFKIVGMVLEGCKYLKYNASRIWIEKPTIWRFTSILACKKTWHFKSCHHSTQKHSYIGCVVYPANSCIPQAFRFHKTGISKNLYSALFGLWEFHSHLEFVTWEHRQVFPGLST